MPRTMPAPARSLAVIGGGVIGLSVARRAALDGWSVRVHRTDDPGASWVAGGMLAPHSEGWPGEERLLRLGPGVPGAVARGFLDGLPAEVVTARESLVVAVDRADVADLRTVGEWLSAQGHPVIVDDLPPATSNRFWPRAFGTASCAETELAVDNRAVVEALAAHCERLGVQWAPPVERPGRRSDADAG